MARLFNFAPGPSMLPETVLHEAHAEFLDYHHSGMSALEIGHRTPLFAEIAEHSEALLRSLLNINDDYAILFMPGGATLQYSAIPLNLLRSRFKAAYVNTGHWANMAITEGRRYCDINECEGMDEGAWSLSGDEAYLHYVDNETINGIEFDHIPNVDLPLVCDMSSNILSRAFDINRFALVYAGAQKNLGIPGLSVVIVKKDLLGHAHALTPKMCRYDVFYEKQSMQNTAPTYPWYMLYKVLNWVDENGGVAAMAHNAKKRSQLLYDTVDQSVLYENTVLASARSRMNIPFILKDPSLDTLFLQEAKQMGLLNLKGHRAVGGMRASLYNAMPYSGVQALVTFMQAFEEKVSL